MSEPKKVGRRSFLNYAIAVVATGVIVGAATYFAVPKGEVTVTAPGTTITTTKTVTVTGTPTTSPTTTTGLKSFEEWLKEASKPYKGTTIRVITESSPSSVWYTGGALSRFKELTGIDVVMELQSWDEMYRKSIMDMEQKTGVYDVVYVEQDIAYCYYLKKYTYNLKEFWEKRPELFYPNLDLDDYTILWGFSFEPTYSKEGEYLVALPFEGDIKTWWYRKDLFEDPKEKENFEKQYGWELRPAKTWEEYEQIAEFFYRPDKGLYGHTAQAATHACVGYEVVETFFPTFGVQSPSIPPFPVCNWGINLETKGAKMVNGGLVDSPQAIKALETYIRLLKYAPPGVKSFTWSETAEAFGSGIVVQGPFYSEFQGYWYDPTKSKVIGKIAPTLPPVDPEYYKPTMGVGYFNPAAWGIPSCAPHPEAASLFIQYATEQNIDIQRAREVTNQCRISTLEKLAGSEDDMKKSGYWTFMRDNFNKYLGAPPLGGHLSYIEIYWKNVSRAVAGEITPENCLKTIADQLEEKIKELGYV